MTSRGEPIPRLCCTRVGGQSWGVPGSDFLAIERLGRIAAKGQKLLTPAEEVRDGVADPGSLCEILSSGLGVLRWSHKCS